MSKINRTKQVTFMTTLQECNLIHAEADKRGMTLSAFIRYILMKYINGIEE